MVQRGLLRKATKTPANDSQTTSNTDAKLQHQSSPWLRQFPWDQEVDKLLEERFKIPTGFQELQRESINAAIGGHNVLLVKATGGGKSLTYQLPALVDSKYYRSDRPNSDRYYGLTVVVSPLLALMGDQSQALSQLGITNLLLNSTVSHGAARGGIEQLRSIARACPGSLPNDASSKLPLVLLTSPERIMGHDILLDTLLELSKNGKLQRFVFDEAHCILEWGQSFRKSYQDLCEVVASDFPDIPWTCVTATATPQSRRQLCSLLGAPADWESGDESIVPLDRNDLRRTVAFSATVDRPNLVFRVEPKQGSKEAGIAAAVNAFLESSEKITKYDQLDSGGNESEVETSSSSSNVPCPTGLVYSMYKRDSDDMATELRSIGISAEAYHSDVPTRKRNKVLNQWLNGEIQVICATPAFGMGVNHPSCRVVIHHSLPLSLTSYLQQTGRAGRDNRLSICTLLFHNSDIHRARALVESTDAEEANRQDDLTAIHDVAAYINCTGCRRVWLSKYMDSTSDAKASSSSEMKCEGCNCRLKPEDQPMKKGSIWKARGNPPLLSKKPSTTVQKKHSYQRHQLEDGESRSRRTGKRLEVESRRNLKRRKPVSTQTSDFEEDAQDFDVPSEEILFHRIKRESKAIGVRAPSRKAIRNALEMQPRSVDELMLMKGFDGVMADTWFKYLVSRN